MNQHTSSGSAHTEDRHIHQCKAGIVNRKYSFINLLNFNENKEEINHLCLFAHSVEVGVENGFDPTWPLFPNYR